MSHLRIFVLFSTLLIAGCASGPSGKSFDSAMGEWSAKWQTEDGLWKSTKMTIIDETKATYTSSSGRIFFYAIGDQGKWDGFWVENPGNWCLEEKDGSKNWGVSIFQFNDTYNSYTGTWDMCGEGSKFPTEGFR